MSSPLQFDADWARRIEATYTTADVVEQRRVVVDRLALRAGEDVLDIGSGPGLLACEMAAVVGSDGSVHGIDPSESMRAIAGGRRPREDSAPVTFGMGDANALPFTDASFDVVTSTQVYEYVADIEGALSEAYRGAPSGWATTRTGHRLGLDRVALQRLDSHAPRASCLG
jgi:arsenite methyltransferase